MVLSMAAITNAKLIVSADNWNLGYGDTANLSISTDTTIPYLTGTYEILVVNTDEATIDYTSGTVVSTDSGMAIEHGGDAYYYLGGTNGGPGGGESIEPPAGTNGIGFYVFNMDTTAGIPAGTLFNNIELTLTVNSCEYLCCTLQCQWHDFDQLTFLGSVTLFGNDLPEPMTLGLLGLGGLFLRRRK